MNSSNVPRNAYTDAPEQHPNLIIGSLQLLWWMIFHPSAFRNHITRIDPDLKPDSSLLILIRKKRWRNPALWLLLIQGNLILPILAGLITALVLCGLGFPPERVASGVASGVARALVSGVAFGVVSGVAFGVALGVAFGAASGVAFGVLSDVAWGVASGVTLGVGFGVGFGVILDMIWGLALSVWLGVTRSVLFGVLFGVMSGVQYGVTSGVALGVALGVVINVNLWLPVLLYPFVTIGNFLLYRLDKVRISKKFHFLRWHSAFWDEYQRLPLYGLDKHVLLIWNRNPDEASAALDYLIGTHQRWAVQAVLMELELRRASKLEN